MNVHCRSFARFTASATSRSLAFRSSASFLDTTRNWLVAMRSTFTSALVALIRSRFACGCAVQFGCARPAGLLKTWPQRRQATSAASCCGVGSSGEQLFKSGLSLHGSSGSQRAAALRPRRAARAAERLLYGRLFWSWVSVFSSSGARLSKLPWTKFPEPPRMCSDWEVAPGRSSRSRQSEIRLS